MKSLIRFAVLAAACGLLSGCLAAAAVGTTVGVAGDVAEGAVNVAGDVGQAVIPGDDDDEDRARDRRGRDERERPRR